MTTLPLFYLRNAKISLSVNLFGIAMDYCCDAEFEEYEGEYPKDEFGAYRGCRCVHCESLREKKSEIFLEEYLNGEDNRR